MVFKQIAGGPTFRDVIGLLRLQVFVCIEYVIFSESDFFGVSEFAGKFLAIGFGRPVAHGLSEKVVEFVRFLIFILSLIQSVPFC